MHLMRIRRWSLGNILFRRELNGNRAKIFKAGGQEDIGILLEESALLDVQPPSNLVGFNQIRIDYVDQSVITFLLRIRHLFNCADIGLTLCSDTYELRKIVTHIWPLLAPKLNQLNKLDVLTLIELRNLICPSVLRDCANLRIVHAVMLIYPAAPSDDRAEASDGQALAKWLQTPRSDGRPKVLICHFSPAREIYTKFEGLKMEFLNAKSAVSYLICVEVIVDFDVGPFEVENRRTQERMTFQRTASPYQTFPLWLLKRGPILWDDSEWTESERKAKASFGGLSEEMNSTICCKDVKFCNTFI